MELNDEDDLDKMIQQELDILSLDESIDDLNENDENDIINVDNDEEIINETKRNLERNMHERLKAFENEINMNFNRYEIDYTEIDELLQKPIQQNDIENHVAQQCGIEREELDRILQDINSEEFPDDTTVDSARTEHEEYKIQIIKRSIATIDTDESAEPTPREPEEDPNKKLFDERLAESHRRMLDELALLDQRRKEEEERYAVVLQEQQTRLADEYRRLKETLAESARQTEKEKNQFENLCREQERLTNERQNKMATIIQAWYRGRRIYRQYHNEILKRATPTLKAIAKRRKKQEQENLINATKLTKIQEVNVAEKENNQKPEISSIPSPMTNRMSSPLPDLVNKPTNSIQKPQLVPKKVEVIPTKEDSTKKTKSKQQTKQTPKTSLPTTEIVQLENPADFIPTIIPEQRTVLTPRITRMENKKTNNIPHISSQIQSKEEPPKSANKQPIQTNNVPITTEPIKSNTHTITEDPPRPITRSDTFDKNTESLAPPLIENKPVTKSINRSGTFDTETESIVAPQIDDIPISRATDDLFPPTSITQSESPQLIEPKLTDRSETFFTKSETPRLPSGIHPSIQQAINTENRFSEIISSTKESIEIIPNKVDIPLTPRILTPPKISNEGKHPIKFIYSFLNEARRWAENNRDITYSNLLQSAEETSQQIPLRKTTNNLRKLPDLDSQILTKVTKNQSPYEIRFLLLEQILTPCSLALIGNTYRNLTHLTLRQCKLVHLTGLESCSSLTILDIEGNWLEQIHLQSNHLEYLNMSRNRLTTLLSLNTPHLKYLNVSKNRLTRLNGLETLTNLNILIATSNQLLTTLGLQGCTNLLHIDVSDNHLVEMEQLDQCPLLITIKATSNALIQIPNLFNAILLHEIDFSSNSLTAIDDLSFGSWLPFLTHLRLANNSLQELIMIKLPSLIELDLGFNQISDVPIIKRFIKTCSLLSRLNLEQNPVLCDIADTLDLIKNQSYTNPITVLPQLSPESSSESIELYLNFLTNITLMLIRLRQSIEQYQIEPFDLIKSIRHQCQLYYEQKITEPIYFEPIEKKVPSPEEQCLIRLQAHWRRRLIERRFQQKRRAAQIIQAQWRGYAVRQRMRKVRRLYSQQQQQQQQIYDEIDLSQFDFDEAAFEARFQRPHTPAARIQQVWQPQQHVLSKNTTITELAQPISSRTSSTASSRAKPFIEPLAMPKRTEQITNEWGFTPSSTTAALMLKRAEKMKWNAERRHKREHMDAYQRLQMARNHEQPPGTLRLARRQASLTNNTTKPIVNTQHLSPPSTAQSRPNRVYEWIHTQVARFDDSSTGDVNSPRGDRRRLPSLDGSTDPANRMRPNDNSQQQQRWNSSTASVRQPPSLLPPINGHLPRV